MISVHCHQNCAASSAAGESPDPVIGRICCGLLLQDLFQSGSILASGVPSHRLSQAQALRLKLLHGPRTLVGLVVVHTVVVYHCMEES